MNKNCVINILHSVSIFYERKQYSQKYRENNKQLMQQFLTEYHKNNQKQLQQYQKNYRLETKKKVTQKFECECGGKYTYGKKQSYSKTKKHKSWAERK